MMPFYLIRAYINFQSEFESFEEGDEDDYITESEGSITSDADNLDVIEEDSTCFRIV